MSALATLLGTYAPGHVLTHDGRDYVFSRVDQAMKTALSVAYFKRAREAVYALRDEVSDAEFDRQLGRVTDAYRRGEYSFPLGESYKFFLSEGLPELVGQLTGQPPAEVAALVEERSIEVLHVVMCCLVESGMAGATLKKTMLAREGTPEMQLLIRLLSTTNATP